MKKSAPTISKIVIIKRYGRKSCSVDTGSQAVRIVCRNTLEFLYCYQKETMI